MSPATDPYRTLGLSRGASLVEVKRAYRQLAKENHPDAAGPAALPRFLAIQAAYEQLVDGTGAPTARQSAARASAADPSRADATHRAYGGRSRRRPSGAGTEGDGGRRSKGSAGTRGSSASGSAGGSAGSATGAPEADGASGEAPRKRGKATLGSTSYDGADATPFEPDWSGASWYGTTSGTYWTINPKEYADPRKHGPEYQARARRATQGRAGAAAVPEAAEGGGAAASGPTDDHGTEPDPATAADAPDDVAGSADDRGTGPSAPEERAHTTSSWWTGIDDEPGSGPTAAAAPPPPAPISRPSARPAAPAPDLGAAASDLGRALTDERSARGRWRVAQAVVGWLPIAFGLGWVIGELTGCGRSSASCDGADSLLGPAAAGLALVVLLLVPRLAALAAAAAIAVAIVAVPAAAILSASGDGEPPPPDRSAALGVILFIAWSTGLVIGVARRLRVPPTPVHPGGPVS